MSDTLDFPSEKDLRLAAKNLRVTALSLVLMGLTDAAQDMQQAAEKVEERAKEVAAANEKRVVAVGTRGPAFGETLHAHVGKGGLRSGFYEQRGDTTPVDPNEVA